MEYRDELDDQLDELVRKIARKLRIIFTEAEKEVGGKMEAYAAQMRPRLDEAYKEWLDASDPAEQEKAKAEYIRLVRNFTSENKHFRALVNDAAARYEKADETAAEYINARRAKAYALGHNYEGRNIDGQLASSFGVSGELFDVVDERTVRELAMNEKNMLPPRRKIVPTDDTAWNFRRINTQVLQGVIQGEPIGKITSRLLSVARMDLSQAIRAARTMVTAACNKGRQDARDEAEDMGAVIAVEWGAILDGATRSSHAELDGVRVKNGERFPNGLRYPGDPSGRPEEVWNCRCRADAVVIGYKPWKEALANG